MKKRFTIGHLTIGVKTVVEAAVNERIEIEQLFFANTSGGTQTFDLHHVPAGDAAATSNFTLMAGTSVSSGKSSELKARIYLEPGDKLTAVSSAASSIVLTLYGISVKVRGDGNG